MKDKMLSHSRIIEKLIGSSMRAVFKAKTFG